MESKTTEELLRFIRNLQTKLSMTSMFGDSDGEINILYEKISQAEKIILSRVIA